MASSTTSELPRIISFFAVEGLLLLLNIYFIAKLIHYIRYVKAGGNSLRMDWYLIATFITLTVALLIRSSINLVIYIEELIFEKSGIRP